jgi:hypothetical protein
VRSRLPEIEGAIFERIRGLSGPMPEEDPTYVAGLRATLSSSIAYALDSLEKGEESSVPVPPEVCRQARRAAREGVRLDTVLRRYASGGSLLEEYVVAAASEVPGALRPEVIGERGPSVDRLMEVAAREYQLEVERGGRSSTQQRAERVAKLLEGSGPAGPIDIDYDLDLFHVGLILKGDGGGEAVRAMAARLGARALVLPREEDVTWAWLGSARRPKRDALDDLRGKARADLWTAVGAARPGLDGWRLTHREAQLALRLQLLKPQPLLRGADAVLTAAVIGNETLVRALVDNYLGPLREGDGSGSLLETLRAYFSAGGNASAAAAGLGVTRHTVQRRIRIVEQRLGRLIHTCHAELQVALEVEDLLGGS